MKNIKSHFRFSKSQRNGILLLVILIISLQLIFFFIKQGIKDRKFEGFALDEYQDQIDSLKYLASKDKELQLYPFNPNFITDFKGYSLGMSNEEIDRLLSYRAKGKWINSKADFQKVTGVSDSLLNQIAPFFKFPNWVKNSQPSNSRTISNDPKSFSEKIDLNEATQAQLMRVNGVGEVLSKRIVEYRSNLDNGFASSVQLSEVHGLEAEVIERINNEFAVKTPAQILTININSASRDQLVLIRYIDYEIAHSIIEFRTLNEGFKSLDELTKVKGFPVERIAIIKLYLHL